MAFAKTEILSNILERVKREADEHAEIVAVGRADIIINGEKRTIWLTNIEDLGTYKAIRTITGDLVGTYSSAGKSAIKDMGVCVYKNSPLGGVIALHNAGKHQYTVGVGANQRQLEASIESKSSYIPNKERRDAFDGLLIIADSKLRESWTSLSEYLNGSTSITLGEELDESLQQYLDEKGGFSSFDSVETDQIEDPELRKAISEFIQNQEQSKRSLAEQSRRRKSFIRKQQSLRSQFILDPKQEKIKRENIFNGVQVVIDGGPGTGKTTTLVQRIKYLTAKSIAQNKNDLTEWQFNLLTDYKRNWVFFSPSPLLRDYLKDNMAAEGLSPGNNNVWHWSEYKRLMMRKYGIYGERKTFKPTNPSSNDFNTLFFQSDAANLRKAIGLVENTLFERWNSLFELLTNFSPENPALNNKLNDARSAYERSRPDSFEKWLILFNAINRDHGESVAQLVSAARGELADYVTKVIGQINSSAEWNELYKELYKHKVTDTKHENFADSIEELRNMVRVSSRDKLSFTNEMNKRQNALIEKIPLLQAKNISNSLAEQLVFDSVYSRLFQGLNINIWEQIVPAFRAARSEDEYKNCLRVQGQKQMTNYANEQYRIIHPEEESLLLGMINRYMASLHRLFGKQFENTAESDLHSYQGAFRDQMRPVIAVDEATDFSLVDLVCMSSFRHPAINSVTFCGDLIQRITSEGLRSWEELDSMLSRLEGRTGSIVPVLCMTTSYRQGNKILTLAKSIFRNIHNAEAPYSAYLEITDDEPNPLLFRNENEENRAEWIAKGILDIDRAYGEGNLPTIAIFVPDEESVIPFTKLLQMDDRLHDCGLQIQACVNGQVLGQPLSIRVFSVEHIKGLEFEAVFFHDVHKLDKIVPRQELIERYLYVGVSRAAYYLGVTTEFGLPQNCGYLTELFADGTEGWK
jgi:hypothetical protein